MNLKAKYQEKLDAGLDPIIKFGNTSRKLSWIAANPVEAIHRLHLEHMFEASEDEIKSLIRAVDERTGEAKRTPDYQPRALKLPASSVYNSVGIKGVSANSSASTTIKLTNNKTQKTSANE